MIAAWMLYASAVTAFLGLGAVAVEKSLRFVRQPGRWILAAAIVGAVFVPVVTRSESAAANADVAGFSATAPTASLVPLTAIFPNSAALQSLDVPLIALWIGVTLVLVVLLFSTQAHLAKRVRAYREENLFGTKVLRSTALGPAVVGWLKTAIVIPAWVDDVGGDSGALMVRHEREHLRGWDAQLLSTAVLLVILQPWNLPLWGLLFRLRRSIELDCDQRVLKSGVDVGQYGNLLLEMSRRRMRFALPIVGLAVRTSFLARRVETMTVHMSAFKLPKALLAVGLGGTFAAIACELPAPVEPPVIGAVLLQEISLDPDEGGAVAVPSLGEDDEILLAFQPTPEELRRVRMALNINAVLNSANLGRLPQRVAERLRDHKLLLKVREQDGNSLLILRSVSEEYLEEALPAVLPVPLGR
jgi:bla regulator protein BlaR1